MPRIPKPDSERQRRNIADRFVGVSEIGGGTKPPRISREESQGWCAQAKRWWRAVRGSEQAATYTATDWEVALRCVALINGIHELDGLTPAARGALGELRQLEDRLLVTVAARRRARVDLPGGKAGGDGRPVTGARGAGSKVIDYRQALGAR